MVNWDVRVNQIYLEGDLIRELLLIVLVQRLRRVAKRAGSAVEEVGRMHVLLRVVTVLTSTCNNSYYSNQHVQNKLARLR